MRMTIVAVAWLLALVGALAATMFGASAIAQTPNPEGCAVVGAQAATTAAETSSMDHRAHTETTAPANGTADVAHEVDFDLMYIDMMIPHHESIIALAEVAQGELTHPRLIEIAEVIITTQDAEIEKMESLRTEWYPDAAPVSMDVLHGMPGMSGDMAAMEQQMDPQWQVQTFCAAADKDLAFIEQVIPHHQMALDVSVAANDQAVHPELVTITEAVIAAQQSEITELETIRAELTAEATPAST